MVLYRSIKKSYSPLSGSVAWSIHDTLLDAYKMCIPSDETFCCRRVYMSVYERLLVEQIVCVTHVVYEEHEEHEDGEIPCKSVTYWIEKINMITDPMPLNPPQAQSCCHR